MFSNIKLVYFFFIICTTLSNVLPEVGRSMSIFLAIITATFFFNYSRYIYLFILYCFFTTHMYSGNFLLFELNLATTYEGMTNISNISFMALVLIILGKKFFQGDFRLKKINFYDPIIVFIAIFVLTQLVSVFTSSNFEVSIKKFNQLLPYTLLFYFSQTYLSQIKIEYLIKFFGNISVIIVGFHIYNILIMGDSYTDDGVFLLSLPFFFNLILITKNKFFIPMYSVFIMIVIYLLDSRRLLISLFIYLNNIIFRIFKKKSNYFIFISFTLIIIILTPSIDDNDSDIRIFDTIKIVGKLISGQELDNSDLYNLFTKRDILAIAGIEMFLENPILGQGLGMNPLIGGRYFFGDYTSKNFRLHNLYLEILAESGIFGGLAYLILLFLLLKRLWSLINDINLEKNYKVAAFVLFDLFVVISIMNLFGSRGPYDKIEWFFYSFVYFLSTSIKGIRKEH